MKRIIALVLALVMCLCLFAGCGKTEAPAAEAPAAEEPAAEAPAAEPGAEEPAAEEPAEPVDDTVYEFIVVNHDATTSMCEEFIETLCGQMEEESGGRLKFVFYPGGSLLGATETIDGVAEGTADICWSCTSFFGKRFPISEFINLCQNGVTSARMSGDVFQAMYEQIPECKAEYEDWYVIGLHSCACAPLCTVGKKIESPADFKGLQIRAAGTIPSMYLTALGATPISMPTSDVYESLSKGVIDGMANDWHNIDCFKLYEAVDYCLDVPVNYTSCFVLMNKDRYEALPADLQAIFDKYSKSGYAGDMGSYWWDSCNFWVGDKMEANGVEIYTNDEVAAFMASEEIVSSVHQFYIDYLTELGLDGQAIYDKCMEIVASYADAYPDPYATEFNYADWDLASVDGYVNK